MDFTAKDVQALREKTGVGMMACKKALVEADGDMDKAVDILREKGLAASQKKAGRIAAEGIALAYVDEAAKVGVLVEVNSETDFVAKNDTFKALVLAIAKTVAKNNPADNDALLAMTLDGSDRTVQESFQDAILKIGENMKLRRFVRYEGEVATYIHFNSKIGVMVLFDAADEIAAKDEFKEMGKGIAMQIASMNPSYLDQASVPAEVLEKERAINLAQMKEDPKMANKPAQVLDKIIDGKIAKFYKENCLVDQAFVKDDSLDIKGYVAQVAKQLGGAIAIKSFIRYEVGEGLEKKEENFADEIAKMIK